MVWAPRFSKRGSNADLRIKSVLSGEVTGRAAWSEKYSGKSY